MVKKSEKNAAHAKRRSVNRLIAICLGVINLILLTSPGAGRSSVLSAADSWPISRGDSALTGTTPAQIPVAPRLRWKHDTGSAVLASPVVQSGVVYAASSKGRVYALRLTDGDVLWTFETDAGIEASPLIAGGTLYIGDQAGALHALDALSGRKKWSYRTEGQIMGGANMAPGNPPLILFGSYDYHLYALKSTTGELVWRYKTDHYINGIPAVANGFAVIGGCDEHIHVVSLETGAGERQIKAGSHIAASPALWNGNIYIGHYNGEVLAVDMVNADIRWRFAPEGASAFFASIAVTPTRVLAAGRHGILHCLARESGKELWQFRAQDDIDSSPVIAKDRVLFGSRDGRINALRFEDGDLVWSYLLGSPVSAALAVVDGWIIAGAADGFLYVFGETE